MLRRILVAVIAGVGALVLLCLLVPHAWPLGVLVTGIGAIAFFVAMGFLENWRKAFLSLAVALLTFCLTGLFVSLLDIVPPEVKIVAGKAGDTVHGWLYPNRSDLSVHPESLVFTNVEAEDGSLTTEQQIRVDADEQPTVSWTSEVVYRLAEREPVDWLEVVPRRDTSILLEGCKVTVRVRRERLCCGEYRAEVRFVQEDGSYKIVQVSVDETPMPVLEEAEILVDGLENRGPVEIRIDNRGADEITCQQGIRFEAVDEPELPWNLILTSRIIQEKSTNTTGPIRVAIDIDWQYIIPIEGGYAVDVIIPLGHTCREGKTWEVQTCRLQITVPPASLAFHPLEGLEFASIGASPETRSVSIVNLGAGASIVRPDWANTSSWIKSLRSRTDWSLAHNEELVLDVSVLPGQLTSGTHDGQLSLLYGTDSLVIPATLLVAKSDLAVERDELILTSDQPTALLRIRNSGGYRVDWEVDGICDGAVLLPSTPQEVDEDRWCQMTPLNRESIPTSESDCWRCLVHPAQGVTWCSEPSVIAVSYGVSGERCVQDFTYLRVRNVEDRNDVAFVRVVLEGDRSDAGSGQEGNTE